MIRKATFKDAAAIARIHVGTWRVAYAGIVPDDYLASLSEENRTQGWQQKLTDDRTIIWVAEKDSQVIGWVSGGMSRDADTQGEAEVYAIYVSPQHWDCGVGRGLMATMEASLPDGQSTTLWVLRDNQRAIRFYEKMGYRPDGAQKEIQLGGKDLCAIRFRKSMPNGRANSRPVGRSRLTVTLGGEIMRTTISIIALLTLSVCSLTRAETSVRDLNPPAKVTGSLGQPLGSRLVVEGVRAERVMMGNPLLISVVDGKALKHPVAIEIHGKVQIEPGKQYRLEGYESGAFDSSPDWTVGEGVPQQPFQFYSFFVVTKVLEPKSK